MKSKQLFHLGDIWRMSYLKRWQILADMRQQSVAEHSYNTGVISAEIASRAGLGSYVVECVVTCSTFHDFDEIYTGDIPTVTKQTIGGGNLDYIMDTIGGLPAFANTKYTGLTKQIVKLADLIEAAAYITINGHPNNTHHNKVKRGCVDAMNSYAVKLGDDYHAIATAIYTELCTGSVVTLDEINQAYNQRKGK